MIRKVAVPREFEAINARQGRQGTQILTVLVVSMAAAAVVWMTLGVLQ